MQQNEHQPKLRKRKENDTVGSRQDNRQLRGDPRSSEGAYMLLERENIYTLKLSLDVGQTDVLHDRLPTSRSATNLPRVRCRQMTNLTAWREAGYYSNPCAPGVAEISPRKVSGTNQQLGFD